MGRAVGWGLSLGSVCSLLPVGADPAPGQDWGTARGELGQLGLVCVHPLAVVLEIPSVIAHYHMPTQPAYSPEGKLRQGGWRGQCGRRDLIPIAGLSPSQPWDPFVPDEAGFVTRQHRVCAYRVQTITFPALQCLPTSTEQDPRNAHWAPLHNNPTDTSRGTVVYMGFNKDRGRYAGCKARKQR